MPRENGKIALLRRAMQELTLSQSAIAERLGLTQGAVSQMLSGTYGVSELIARELGRMLVAKRASERATTGGYVPSACVRSRTMMPADFALHLPDCQKCMALAVYKLTVPA